VESFLHGVLHLNGIAPIAPSRARAGGEAVQRTAPQSTPTRGEGAATLRPWVESMARGESTGPRLIAEYWLRSASGHEDDGWTKQPRRPWFSLHRRAFSIGATQALVSALVGCREAQGPTSGVALSRPLPERHDPERGTGTPAQASSARTPARDAATAPRGSGVPALFERYPALARVLPREALVGLPTPLEHAAELGRALGIERLYVKRDDLAGALHGGNKTRKLEFELARAKADGASEVVTSGAVASNHALATAIYARSLGLRATLLLLPQPPSQQAREHLLAMAAAGASMHLCHGQAEVARRIAALGALPRAERPHVIAAGGSSPLGNIGYVSAGLELAAQVQAGIMPPPDDIYVAMGTMGCAVGLAIGLRAAGLSTRLVAVRASSPSTSSLAARDRMASGTLALLRGLDPSFPDVALDTVHEPIAGGQLGPGYGLATAAGRAAAARFEAHTGLALETTYTGKALAELIASSRKHKGRVVLFWDTYNSRPVRRLDASAAALPPPLQGYLTHPASR
jgi:D-cysteine desulfhydrase